MLKFSADAWQIEGNVLPHIASAAHTMNNDAMIVLLTGFLDTSNLFNYNKHRIVIHLRTN